MFKEVYKGLYPIVPTFTSMENEFGKLYFEGTNHADFYPWKLFDDESSADSRFFDNGSVNDIGKYFHIMLNYPVKNLSLIRLKHGTNYNMFPTSIEVLIPNDGKLKSLGWFIIPKGEYYEIVDIPVNVPDFNTDHLIFRFNKGDLIINELQFYSKYPVGMKPSLVEINSSMYSVANSRLELVEAGNNPTLQSFDKSASVTEIVNQMDLIKAVSDKFKVHVLD